MFVRNPTGTPCHLARGRVTEEGAALSVGVEVAYRVARSGGLEPTPLPRREPDDPPDIRRILLWRGVSVTASGPVFGRSGGDNVRRVSLRVGRAEHRLLVQGARLWARSRGKGLQPSAPEPFERVDLSWSLAFGGCYEEPPGVLPGTDLPHPGGTVHYAWNPTGIGLYRSARDAEGAPLPRIELEDEPVRAWDDRPRPGGYSPCPELGALRLPEALHPPSHPSAGPTPLARAISERLLGPDLLRHVLRLQHHAPGVLVLDGLEPGVDVGLVGVGDSEIHVRVPCAPVNVTARRGRAAVSLAGCVRSVHLCARRRIVRVTYGFFHPYAAAAPPSWVEIADETSRAPG